MHSIRVHFFFAALVTASTINLVVVVIPLKIHLDRMKEVFFYVGAFGKKKKDLVNVPVPT